MEGNQPMAGTPASPEVMEQVLITCISKARSRLDLWVEFISAAGVQRMAEVGVYRGDFAAVMLQKGGDLTRYYMLDPWRHLNAWNKPANQDDDSSRSSFRKQKRRPTSLPARE